MELTLRMYPSNPPTTPFVSLPSFLGLSLSFGRMRSGALVRARLHCRYANVRRGFVGVDVSTYLTKLCRYLPMYAICDLLLPSLSHGKVKQSEQTGRTHSAQSVSRAQPPNHLTSMTVRPLSTRQREGQEGKKEEPEHLLRWMGGRG